MKNEQNIFELKFVKYIINISSALSILYVIFLLFEHYNDLYQSESINIESSIIDDTSTLNNSIEIEVDTQLIMPDTSSVIENNLSEENSGLEYYHIQDPDGYTNLRECEDCSIIRKVYPEELFLKIDSTQNYYLVKFEDGSTGYIHKSRVVLNILD